MLRLGLCCMFREQPIKFRSTRAAALGRLTRGEALARLSEMALANAQALAEALRYCVGQGIGCFRVVSQILPLKTHPELGYEVEELVDGDAIVDQFRACGAYAHAHGLRTCFHPDQYVVLNSPRAQVVEASIRELDYQAEVAEWLGADVINIHAGGAHGDKAKALEALARMLDRLPDRVRSRLTLENDDRIYTPRDLLPFCRKHAIPLVYDAHHHRCLPDRLSVDEATSQALETWNREPLFHISSPLEGWSGPAPHRHHDKINAADFPDFWRGLSITVEVEAKAKEIAVLELMQSLALEPWRREPPAMPPLIRRGGRARPCSS
jgi:UV DNA damage endonuclease